MLIRMILFVLVAAFGRGAVNTQLQDDLNSRYAANRVRILKLADAQQIESLDKLEEREKVYRRTVLDLKSTAFQLQAARRELSQVVAARKRLVEQIEQQNQSFKAEMAAYRREIFGLTETQNPKLLVALQRYADGDRIGADPVIEDILRAENRAIRAAAMAAANRQEAVNIRKLATLRLEMKDRGEKTTADLVAVWAEAQELDPAFHWGWVELGRLYREMGNLPKSRFAAELALETADDERTRLVASTELGDVLVAAGELGEARKRFEQSLAMDEKLARENPTSAEAQRDLSVSYVKMGSVTKEMKWFRNAIKVLEKLDQEGRMRPTDRKYVELLRGRLKAAE